MGPEDQNGDVTQGQTTEDNVVGTSNEGVDQTQQQPNVEDTGGHPAWAEILETLPDEFHPLIKPKLEKWDSGVQTRFENLQSKYKPYEPLIQNDVDMEYIQQAIGLAAAIEQDPQRVYEALAEAYGYGKGQGVADATSGTDDDDSDYDDLDSDDPIAKRLAEQERMMEQLASTFLADREAQEMQEANAQLDAYMSALHEAYDKSGGFDENYVLTMISQGIDGEQAVKQFQESVQRFTGNSGANGGGNGNLSQQQSAGSQAPPIMGGSGGLPSNRTDPRTLSDAETRDYVAQMLKQANEE
ncbi:MAG TPA: hypothetical protein VFK94_01955 [Patescibacteria group bacterium]|nr:hypothetical protein [Patescibacteria group bacterium]